MSLVTNEQAKLTATYINGLAIALFALGIFAPIFSNLYSEAEMQRGRYVFIGAIVCFLTSIALHIVARRSLRGLRQ